MARKAAPGLETGLDIACFTVFTVLLPTYVGRLPELNAYVMRQQDVGRVLAQPRSPLPPRPLAAVHPLTCPPPPLVLRRLEGDSVVALFRVRLFLQKEPPPRDPHLEHPF